MSKMKKFIGLLLAVILVFSFTLTAFAATQNVTIDVESNQAYGSKQFYCSGGSVVKFTFTAANNSNCHYYCTITSGSLYGDAIATTGQVLGSGTDSSTVKAYNMAKGYYIATVRPINGTTNGKTVTCTLKIEN